MSDITNNNPTIPSQIVAKVTFPQFINQLGIIPTSYKDSMDYYQTLAWLCKYLEETVIPTVNQNGEAVEELQGLYVELKDYVDNYFDNLDVQEEINNKLDKMAQDGSLTNLIKDYVDPIYEAYEREINQTVSNQNSQISIQNETITTLSGRVDELATLTEGSTTGDAELTDIRTAYNGYVSNNAGNSVRKQTEHIEKISKSNDILLDISSTSLNDTVITNVPIEAGEEVSFINTSEYTYRLSTTGAITTVQTVQPSDSNYNRITKVFANGGFLAIKPEGSGATGSKTLIIKSKNSNTFDNFKTLLNKNKLQYYGNISASSQVKTSIWLEKGQTYKIRNNSLSNLRILNAGYSDNVVTIQAQKYNTFTPTYSGFLNIQNQGADTVLADVEVYGSNVQEYIIDKNNHGDFTTFNAMCETLDDIIEPKIVYINEGVYDIFDEYGGAEFFADYTTEQGWRDVNVLVPENLTLIGIGEVILQFTPEENEISDTAKGLFSPINITTKNFRMENIKVDAKNCRYAVHDDNTQHVTSHYKNSIHIYKNVNMKKYGSGNAQAYGGGHAEKMRYLFESCIFENTSQYGRPWSTHDSGGESQYEASEFIFNNCIFLNATDSSNTYESLMFDTTANNERKSIVKLNNCYCYSGKIRIYGSSSGHDCYQAFMINAIGCNQLTETYSGRIVEASKVAINQYNVIPVV